LFTALMSRFVGQIVVVATAVGCAGVAFGQDYPTRPIRLLTAGAAGGSDIAARVIARELSAKLGEPVVVDTRVGRRHHRGDCSESGA
jgi:tripartite-type tricarboxylate transporter receptor subunit TctC